MESFLVVASIFCLSVAIALVGVFIWAIKTYYKK